MLLLQAAVGALQGGVLGNELLVLGRLPLVDGEELLVVLQHALAPGPRLLPPPLQRLRLSLQRLHLALQRGILGHQRRALGAQRRVLHLEPENGGTVGLDIQAAWKNLDAVGLSPNTNVLIFLSSKYWKYLST